MSSMPKLLRLSLRYESNDIGGKNVFEESHIIRIYDCYSKGSKDRGDKYRHYYIKDYVSDECKSLLDPKLKICCSRGKIYYSTSNSQFFKELKATELLYLYNNSEKKSSNIIIGRLESLNITI